MSNELPPGYLGTPEDYDVPNFGSDTLKGVGCSSPISKYLDAKLAIMQDVFYVQKQQPKSGIRYTYASEEALIEALRPAMLAHFTVMRPVKSEVLKIERYKTGTGDAQMLWVAVRRVFEFRHTISEQWEHVEVFGEAFDSGDKAFGKAMTHAKKYALRENYLVETGDDPDHLIALRDSPNQHVIARIITGLNAAKDIPDLNKRYEIVAKEKEQGHLLDDDVANLQTQYLNIYADLDKAKKK